MSFTYEFSGCKRTLSILNKDKLGNLVSINPDGMAMRRNNGRIRGREIQFYCQDRWYFDWVVVCRGMQMAGWLEQNLPTYIYPTTLTCICCCCCWSCGWIAADWLYSCVGDNKMKCRDGSFVGKRSPRESLAAWLRCSSGPPLGAQWLWPRSDYYRRRYRRWWGSMQFTSIKGMAHATKRNLETS